MRNLFGKSRTGNEPRPDGARYGYDDLTALFLNCTLKKSPQTSHTDELMAVSRAIMEKAGVKTITHRTVDHDVAAGVYPDMTEHGWDQDDWPTLWKDVAAAEILVIGSPIWLGQYSSECGKVIERLYAHSGQTNGQGQYRFYGKVGGCIVTGNEDGIKHVASLVLYAMQHVGYTIPPQADAGWIGEAGPGPSYGEELPDGTRAGLDNDFTQRNTAFMSYNLMHMALMLKNAGGLPAVGNVRKDWDCHKGPHWPNPEHR